MTRCARARQLGIVGHEHEGRAHLRRSAPVMSSITRAPVAASRLPVGSSANSSFGPMDEGAGQRHALLLAARELGRVVVAASLQPHAGEQHLRAVASRLRRAAPAAPGRSRGAVRVGIRWKDWNTNPTFSPRSRARSSSRERTPGRRRRGGRGPASAGPGPRAGREACSCRCPRGRRWRGSRRAPGSKVIPCRTVNSAPPER